MSNDLKPCPFCGNQNPFHSSDGGCQGFKVCCGNCGCTVGSYYDRDETIKMWQTRQENIEFEDLCKLIEIKGIARRLLISGNISKQNFLDVMDIERLELLLKDIP